ncbi:MAG: DUF3187 family protein, partial [Gammaproteobacteria bacterium]|nr:DUF3187 family protein [Gammaproteobacteria bacterium]
MQTLISHSKFCTACSILLLLTVSSAAGAEEQYLPLRNHNPFLQIFGLPQFQSGMLTEDGQGTSRITFDLANHSESGIAGSESVVIDGESYYLNLSWRYGWSDRIEVGIDLPVVSHNRGFLDSPVERWHDLFGLSNANREGQRNQLRFSFGQPGTAGLLLDSPATGIGDLRISAAYAINGAADGGLALRSTLKLPTGDEDKLMGSGAADLTLG